MPDIVLAYNVSPEIVADLKRGVERYLKRCPWKTLRILERDGVTCLCLEDAADRVQCYRAPDGRELFLAGRLDSRDLPPAPQEGFDSELARIDALLREGGRERIAEIGGRYALFSLETRALHAFSDHFGSKHLYFLNCGAGAVFSTVLSVLTQSSCSSRLNPVGVAEALCLGYPLEGRTLYQGIELLPGGSVTRVCDGKISIEHPAPSFPTRDACYSWKDAVEEAHSLTLASFKAQIPRRPVSCLVPLSGGFDSRFVAAMAVEAGMDPRFSTYGIPGCTDLKVAGQVAAALGTTTRRCIINDTGYLTRRWLDPFLLNGSLCAPNISVFVSFLEQVGRQEGACYITGYMGDVISWNTPMIRSAGGEISVSEPFFQIGELTEFVKDKEIREAAREIPETVARLRSSVSGDERHKDMYLETVCRQRKYTSFQLRLLEAYGTVMVPFEDLRLYRFYSRLPYMAVENKELYKLILKEKYPRLARIPYANDMTPIVPSLSVQLPEFFRSRIRRTLGMKDQQRLLHPVDHSEALRADDAAIVRNKILENPRIGDVFDLNAVKKLTQPPRGYHTNSWRMLALLQVAEARDALAGQLN